MSYESPFMKKPTVLKVMQVSTSGLYLNIRLGTMPPPVKLGLRSVAWVAREVVAVAEARAGGADEDAIRDLVKHLILQRTFSAKTPPEEDIPEAASLRALVLVENP